MCKKIICLVYRCGHLSTDEQVRKWNERHTHPWVFCRQMLRTLEAERLDAEVTSRPFDIENRRKTLAERCDRYGEGRYRLNAYCPGTAANRHDTRQEYDERGMSLRNCQEKMDRGDGELVPQVFRPQECEFFE